MNEDKKCKKHFGSVFTNEQELLKAVLEIHNQGKDFDCDPMYNKGKFYKSILNKPKLKFDLNPQVEGVAEGNAMNLPLEDNSISSMVLDPPFMWRKMIKSKYSIADRYTMFETFEELEHLYTNIIKEASRILTKKGLLVFKCQDFTNNKTTMTHIFVYNWLEKNNFYVKDLAILNKANKIANGNLTQRHFRKTHTYFWVAIKK